MLYVVYHMTGGFETKLEGIPAVYGEYTEHDDGYGYIFRYESTVSSGYSGTVDYSIGNGERVAVGDSIAVVYEHENEKELTAELVEIDRMIELLTESNMADNEVITDTKKIDEQIKKCMESIIECRREGNAAALSKLEDELLVALNRRELIIFAGESYDEQIAHLKSKRKEISEKLTGENERITASESGYFYYECDGYEGVFSPELLETLTPSALDALLMSEPVSGGGIGKSVKLPEWHIAVEMDITKTSAYTAGKIYDVQMLDYADMTCKMTLEKISSEKNRALLIFSCDTMPEDFGFERRQSVRVVKERYEGLKIPAAALRLDEGVEGVFVLYGNTVFFRHADVIGKDNGYVYVNADAGSVINENGEERSPLALYDKVIIKGTGLYHTMIVN